MRFSYRPSDEGARPVPKKPEGKYFSLQNKQTKLIRNELYGFWSLSSWLLTKLCVGELAA